MVSIPATAVICNKYYATLATRRYTALRYTYTSFYSAIAQVNQPDISAERPADRRHQLAVLEPDQGTAAAAETGRTERCLLLCHLSVVWRSRL